MSIPANRLRFLHNDTIWETREEAMNYVLGMNMIELPSLYAEPMVLRYGNKENPNIILAIGSVGTGEPSQKNKTFFIDYAKVKEDIDSLVEKENLNDEEIKKLHDTLDKVIKASGLSEEGEYVANAEDMYLKNANSLFNADSLLSEALKAEVERAEKAEEELTNKTKFNVENTKTIELSLKEENNVKTLKGSVKIANPRISGDKVKQNCIVKDETGIYSNIDVYKVSNKDGNDKLNLEVNGNVTEICELPKDKYLVSGKYDTKTESLILSFNFGEDIIVNMEEMLGEWGVLSEEAQVSPIVLKKEPVASNFVLHGADKFQDILSADVRIATKEEKPNNILQKSENNRYLFVDGTAENIRYWKNGEQITVKQALDNIDVKVSKDENNIIKDREDGLFADVKLSYDVASNTLKFTNGNVNKDIKLNSAELIDDVTYDSSKECIVIRFKLADGQFKKIEIPVGDIITEWDVNNTYTTVTLERERSKEGTDILKANVNIADKDNNILKVVGHALCVEGESSNIAHKDETVFSVLDRLEGNSDVEGSVRNLIKKEKDALVADNLALQEKITTETNRAKKAEEANSDAINAEKVRAEKVEEDLRNKVNANESKVNNNVQSIASLTQANVEQDKRLQSLEEAKVSIEDNVNKAVSGVESNKEKITTVEKNLASEAERAKLAEKELSNTLKAEKERAVEKENKLQKDIDTLNGDVNTPGSVQQTVKHATDDLRKEINDISTEIDQVIESEIANVKKDLEIETNRAVSAENAIKDQLQSKYEEVKRSVENETVRAKLAEEANKQAISDEVIRARAAEQANADNIVAETNRAIAAETLNENAILNETNRAKDAERANSEAIVAERNRATTAEQANANSIITETTRAKVAEQANADEIARETSRAKVAEEANKQAIADETNRSKEAEAANTQAINAESDRAKAAEKALEESIKRNEELANGKINDVKIEKTGELTYTLFANGDKDCGSIVIPKDQFLDSVSYDSDKKTMTFVFITNTEKNNIVTIDVSDLVDTYTAGKGLDLTEGMFSIKVNDGNENEFLTIDESGVKLHGIREALDSEKQERVSGDASTLAEAKSYGDEKFAEKVSLNEEIIRAKASEKTNNEYITNVSNKVDGNIASINKLSEKATELSEKINGVDTKVDNNIASINKIEGEVRDVNERINKVNDKADANALSITDLRNSSKLTNEHISNVEKKTDVNTSNINRLGDAVKSIAPSVKETNTVKMTVEKSANGSIFSSDVKINQELGGNILKVSGNGLYANVELGYNKDSNTITLNNGNVTYSYELSSHSLVTEAHYDSSTKSIVMTITKEGGEIQTISIPVNELVNEWKVEDTVNNPIKLEKVQGSDGIDVLKAKLDISKHSSNLIIDQNGTLFASNEAKDHTVIWTDGKVITVQEAINRLKDVDNGALSDRVDALENKVNNFDGRITNLEIQMQNVLNSIEEIKKITDHLIDFETY